MLANTYRPEIDGLRAIAVIAVILYHAKFILHGINILEGGYIGVDIFFVISGYLITRIILNEIKEGKFSYYKFYERRARRILPALFVVMLASIPLAYAFMLPKSMKEYAASILAALAFDSNVWFWKEDSYWAEPSSLKPFLHTWSLSIEEQFYFIFPTTLLLLWKYARKYVMHFIVGISLLSLVLAHVYSKKFASATFYLLPTRGWELLAGAFLASRECDKKSPQSILGAIMPALGLMLIIISIGVFNDKTRHPSFITLLPVLGTLLLIWYSRKGEWISDILGSKPLVFIGLISYELYLWHFPVFAFSKIKQPDYSEFVKIEWIIITLALSVLTYFLIGKPARNMHTLRSRPFFMMLGSLFVTLLITEIYFYKTNGAEFRFGDFNKLVETNYWDETREYRAMFWTHNGCWLTEKTIVQNDPFKLCKSSETLNSRNRIMVIGDSNVASLIPGLIKYFGKNNIVQRIVNGCLPARTFPSDFCRAGLTAAFMEIDKIKPDLIIIGGFYLTNEHLAQLKFLFDHELKNYRSQTVILGPLPRWREEGLPAKLQKIYSYYPFKIPVMLKPGRETFELDNQLTELTSDWKIAYLSPVKTFCTDSKCLVKVGKSPQDITSWDGAHLTHNASYYLVEKNINLIRKFLS